MTSALGGGGGGGVLNHAEKEFIKNSNSFMVSKLTNVAAPLLFMIFDILISIALSLIFYKFFFTRFMRPPRLTD